MGLTGLRSPAPVNYTLFHSAGALHRIAYLERPAQEANLSRSLQGLLIDRATVITRCLSDGMTIAGGRFVVHTRPITDNPLTFCPFTIYTPFRPR